MANIELPKDVEGREIPLDTNVLYDQDGTPHEVARFAYTLLRDCDKWDVIFVNGYDRYASEMLLEMPDSWEKLEKDLGIVEDFGGTSYLDGPACAYAHSIGKSCGECKLYGGTSCVGKMCADIASRIRKLRGES